LGPVSKEIFGPSLESFFWAPSRKKFFGPRLERNFWAPSRKSIFGPRLERVSLGPRLESFFWGPVSKDFFGPRLERVFLGPVSKGFLGPFWKSDFWAPSQEKRVWASFRNLMSFYSFQKFPWNRFQEYSKVPNEWLWEPKRVTSQFGTGVKHLVLGFIVQLLTAKASFSKKTEISWKLMRNHLFRYVWSKLIFGNYLNFVLADYHDFWLYYRTCEFLH